MPFAGTETVQWTNGLYEAVSIILIFPLIVAIGAGSSEMGAKTSRVCKWLGEISFPLYITHYPLIYIQTSWALSNPDAPTSTCVWVSVSVFVVAVAIAHAMYRLYDVPVRAWLKKKLFK